jgi:hypothetical protein
MLIGGVQEPRRVQTINELAQPIETWHNFQRIPLRFAVLRGMRNRWSSLG